MDLFGNKFEVYELKSEKEQVETCLDNQKDI